MNCTSWTRGLSTRLGGEPQKYGGEHPRFDESLHPLLLRIMSKISNPALSSLCSGVWLRCHLKGFGSSEDGWLTKPSLSGFGQMTTSSSDFSLKNAALSLPISFILLFFPNPNSNLRKTPCACINTGLLQHGWRLDSLKWRTTYPSSNDEENPDGLLELFSYTTDRVQTKSSLAAFWKHRSKGSTKLDGNIPSPENSHTYAKHKIVHKQKSEKFPTSSRLNFKHWLFWRPERKWARWEPEKAGLKKGKNPGKEGGNWGSLTQI